MASCSGITLKKVLCRLHRYSSEAFPDEQKFGYVPCHFLLVAGPMFRDQGPFRSGFLKHRIHLIIMHSDRQSPNSRTRSMLDFAFSGRGLCDNGMDDRGYQDHE
jgi:hypothetical protein